MIQRTINAHILQRYKLLLLPSKHYTTSSVDEYHDLVSLIQSCKHVSETVQIHGLMLKTGLDKVPFPLSKLLAHVSLQDISYAASIFENIKSPNHFMFNTMFRGYSVSNEPKKALALFNSMRVQYQSYREPFLLDQFTFISIIKSCARLFAERSGLGVHSVVLKHGFDLFLNVKNALLHFYCVCGRIVEANKVFDELGESKDLVSWNTLLGGYLFQSRYDLVMDMFRELYEDVCSVNVKTVLCVLSAVSEIKGLVKGECLHGFCLKIGFLSDLNVVAGFISMYGKHGLIGHAREVFNEVNVKKDVVLWNSLIDGYAKNGLIEEAMKLLKLMKLEKVRPNSSTLASLLSSCASSGALSLGRSIHDYVEEQNLPLDVVLGTALVDMYVKTGLLGEAVDVFDRMKVKDVKSWTAMIFGYGVHGHADQAITLFDKMEKEGSAPNEVTFLAVLSSCSHAGLVSEGARCFRRMVEGYGLKPKIEHYGCVIDLLGRKGLLEEAYELIKGLKIEVDATAWRALLAACKIYGNIDLGERVIRELEAICGENPADSLALAGTYAVVGRRLDCTEKLVVEGHGAKEAGWSMIEFNDKGVEQLY